MYKRNSSNARLPYRQIAGLWMLHYHLVTVGNKPAGYTDPLQTQTLHYAVQT